MKKNFFYDNCIFHTVGDAILLVIVIVAMILSLLFIQRHGDGLGVAEASEEANDDGGDALIKRITLKGRHGEWQQDYVSFYNADMESWCFVVPSVACDNLESLKVDVTKRDGSIVEGELNLVEGEKNLSEGIKSLAEGEGSDESVAGANCRSGVLRFDNEERRAAVILNDCVKSLYIETGSTDTIAFLNNDKKNMLGGSFSITDEDGVPIQSGGLERINGRGHNSWKAAKKGYAIELAESMSLLGMGKADRYNLVPGYRDNSLMTYVVTRDMYKEMGFEYPPDYELVNFYLDGEYAGVYFLTENCEISEARIDIRDSYYDTRMMNGDRLMLSQRQAEESDGKTTAVYYDIQFSPADVTGGYLYQLCSTDYDKNQSKFRTDSGTNIYLSSNYYATKEQVKYSQNLFNELDEAVFSENGVNHLGKKIEDYIDMKSAARQWLLFELSMESSFKDSTYFYKDSDLNGDGKLHALWLWDSEHNFYPNEDDPVDEPYFDSDERDYRFDDSSLWFLRKILDYGPFRDELKSEWNNTYLPVLDMLYSGGGEYVRSFEEYKSVYAAASGMNSLRWPKNDYVGKMDELKSFFDKRIPFMTEYVNGGCNREEP